MGRVFDGAKELMVKEPVVSAEADLQAASQPIADPVVPLGMVGTDTGRDHSGRFVAGNTAALVTGHMSAAFWREQEAARRDICRAILADAGFSEGDAPEALRIAADGVAMATLIRDSAFLRIVEAGGPLTSKGRGRRSFAIWDKASTILERHLRLVGLSRTTRPALTFADAIRAQAAALARGNAAVGPDAEGAEGEPPE